MFSSMRLKPIKPHDMYLTYKVSITQRNYNKVLIYWSPLEHGCQHGEDEITKTKTEKMLSSSFIQINNKNIPINDVNAYNHHLKYLKHSSFIIFCVQSEMFLVTFNSMNLFYSIYTHSRVKTSKTPRWFIFHLSRPGLSAYRSKDQHIKIEI